MSNTLEAIHLLEDKLKNLLSNYEFLKNEHQVIESRQQLVEQKKDFNLLKIAKTIEGSSTNTKDTKLKINTLIREIDKCIVQLQE
jgi:hypothetical protein